MKRWALNLSFKEKWTFQSQQRSEAPITQLIQKKPQYMRLQAGLPGDGTQGSDWLFTPLHRALIPEQPCLARKEDTAGTTSEGPSP